MSGFQDVYLGMVLVAFLAFMAGLAWGQFYSRGGRK